MPLDSQFLKVANEYCNPYLATSGTEHVGILLYSLARMTRPQKIIEYGSGHSTMYVLRALADNVNDIKQEKTALLEKTQKLLSSADNLNDEAAIFEWFSSGGKACGVNPEYYLQEYHPKLISFEDLNSDHKYVQGIREAISQIGHDDIFEHMTGQSFSNLALHEDHKNIDWAWNDHIEYKRFFTEFWPLLNPQGGLMIFHNTPSQKENYQAIEWMLNSCGDEAEVLLLEEPHKLNQNGCTILRKKSHYNPTFHHLDRQKTYNSLLQFISRQKQIII
ncbi:hypothetical protein HG263_12390 [Pseudoalteromonas sp. JBTF-M23]|uniref:Methyltransferase family protein n=1 Tax=Pseudoalteromonas caenipelagi TaxID=2726988 RepID=A0A849VI28_9GAMM|nr:class I SAM-dependent methyltransferase [Pseudoalteromonas caenipelagi]NOU51327.1 hypothetical protein [Pseudoalteromonas caenipelagi]